MLPTSKWACIRLAMNMERKIALNRQFDTSPTFSVMVKGTLKGKGDNQVGDKKPVNRVKPDRKTSCKSGDNNTLNHKRRDRTDKGKPSKHTKIR
jgi:hypothetical protein